MAQKSEDPREPAWEFPSLSHNLPLRPLTLALSQLVPLSLRTPLKSFLLVSPSGLGRPLAPMELPSTKEEAEL